MPPTVGAPVMISLLDLVGALGALGALVLLLTKGYRRFSVSEKGIVVFVCVLTIVINCQGAVNWWGHVSEVHPSETWADYLQVLQPVLWGMFFYVVVQNHQRRELVENQQKMRSIVENMPVILHAFDDTGRLVAWNRFAEEITGYSKDELINTDDALERLYPDCEAREQVLQECHRRGGSYNHRIRTLLSKQRTERQIAWYNISARFPIPGWANWGIGLDITEQLAAQRELEHKATHDDLTRLPNRALLRDRLVHALTDTQRNNSVGAVLLLDLDHFKMVNDAHGHPVGDRLLIEVAARLKSCIKATDTLSRFGGDEFLILLEQIKSPEEVSLVAERLVTALTATPFLLFGNEVQISTSIGITLFPDDDVRIDELIKNVDLALYAAKEAGRNGYHFYSRVMHKRLRWQHRVSEKLREALHAGDFELHYQPQVQMQDRQVVGGEALLRWSGIDNIPLSPAVFIPIAENMGLMPALGKWVIDAAIKQAAEWRDRGPFSLAINLSPVQFFQPNLLDTLLFEVEAYGIAPQQIEFEITESAVMRDLDTAIATMRKLAKHGFGLSLDDFGTGYSSLSYLKRFPVTKIKIDKSFVQGIETDPADAAIVRSIIDLGHCLNIKVLAEGVETKGQYDQLLASGCDYMQGFYFSRPLPSAQFEHYLPKTH